MEITLDVTRENFQKIIQDPEYHNQVVSKATIECGFKPTNIFFNIISTPAVTDIDEILKSADELLNTFEEDPCEEDFVEERCEPLSAIDPAPDNIKDVWQDAPTKLLLSLLKDLRPKVGKKFALKTKNKMWQQIQGNLSEKGYKFNVAQVQGKFRSLERRYKLTKLHNRKTGMDKITCPFESELDEIFRGNRAVNPENMLDSEDAVTDNMDDVIADMNSASQSSTSGLNETEGASKKRRRLDIQSKWFKKLDDIETAKKEHRQKKLQFQEKFLQALIEKNQIEKKRATKF